MVKFASTSIYTTTSDSNEDDETVQVVQDGDEAIGHSHSLRVSRSRESRGEAAGSAGIRHSATLAPKTPKPSGAAFAAAAMEEAAYDGQYKILMVGHSGSGKSALLRRFLDHSFSDAFVPTVGVELVSGTAIVGVCTRGIVMRFAPPHRKCEM